MSKSLIGNYKKTYAVRDKSRKSTIFSNPVSKPGTAFRVFIPPGTTDVSLLGKAGRDSKIGIAARLDLDPLCKYNTGVDYGSLKFVPINSARNLSDFSGKDVQRRNRGGTLKIIEGPVGSTIEAPGHWMCMKTLSYDGSDLAQMNITITVDTKKFLAWRQTSPFDAQGQPSFKKGPGGGACDQQWESGGEARNAGPSKRGDGGEGKKKNIMSAFDRIKNMRK